MIQTKKHRHKPKRGFTLIELITVIFILAIIMAIMIPNMRRAFYKAKLTGCQSNLRNLATGVHQYSVENEHYPTNLGEISPKYIKNIPTCPKAGTNTYTSGYEVSVDRDHFTIKCSGRNHTVMGLGENEPWYNLENGLGP